MCPDGEPEHVFTDEQLRYPDPASEKGKKEKAEKTFTPFKSVVVDTKIENGETHFHGVCGRDVNGLPTVAEGYRVAPDDGMFTADDKPRFGSDHLCHLREMSGEELARYKQANLIPPDIDHWWVFLNPDTKELKDSELWP